MKSESSRAEQVHRVAIIGAGFGGIAAAQALKDASLITGRERMLTNDRSNVSSP